MMAQIKCERCGKLFTPIRGVQKRCGSLSKKKGCSYEWSLENGRRWHQENADRAKRVKRTYYDTHPWAFKRHHFFNRITRYGLNEDQYDQLFMSQEGKCAICREEIGYESSHIDHSHETKEVRGLLCGKCNRGLGMYNDDPELLLKANKYLKEDV